MQAVRDFLRRHSHTVRFVTVAAAAWGVGAAVVFWLIPTLFIDPKLHGLWVLYAAQFFGVGMLLALLTVLAWHMYKEVTDPVLMAARLRAVRKLTEEKKFEPLMNKLADAVVNKALNEYFPPIGPRLSDRLKLRARSITYRAMERVREVFT